MTDPTRISDDQHNNAPAPAPAQGEPFGYFRAEPFGWTDCSEDAEGAIALYEHPAAPAQEVELTDELEQLGHIANGIRICGVHDKRFVAQRIDDIIAALRAKGGK